MCIFLTMFNDIMVRSGFTSKLSRSSKLRFWRTVLTNYVTEKQKGIKFGSASGSGSSSNVGVKMDEIEVDRAVFW